MWWSSRSTPSFAPPGCQLKSIGPRTTLKLVAIDVPCSGPNKKAAEIKFPYWDLLVIIPKRIFVSAIVSYKFQRIVSVIFKSMGSFLSLFKNTRHI